MTFPQKVIVLLTWLSIGLTQPVLSLMLLTRGAAIGTLSVVLGVFSAAVLLAEFPSGVFADLFGRKNTYFLSLFFYTAGSMAMIFSHSLLLLIAAMVLQGLGRAFSSGSIEALIIDDCLERKGIGYTARTTSQLAVCQSIGLSVGALAGGFLPSWNEYSLHLIIRIAVMFIAGILCFFCTIEKRKPRDERVSVKKHMCSCFDLVKTTSLIQVLLVGFFVTGLLLITVETYWQPAFVAIVDPKYTSLVGVICFIGFGTASLGNLIMHKLNVQPPTMQRIYFLMRLLSGASVIILALQSTAVGFILCYGLLYLILGIADIAEQTLINDSIKPDNRSSLLSLLSLTGQTGCLFGSAAASMIIGGTGYSGIWISGGILIILVIGSCKIIFQKRQAINFSNVC